MVSARVATVLLLAVITASAQAPQSAIRIPLAGDVAKVTFDSSKVSSDDVRRWMQLSPNVGNYNEYLIPENLDMCFADDARYQGMRSGTSRRRIPRQLSQRTTEYRANP